MLNMFLPLTDNVNTDYLILTYINNYNKFYDSLINSILSYHL